MIDVKTIGDANAEGYLRHVPIQFDGGMDSPYGESYFISKTLMFGTIPELIKHYQTHSMETCFPHVPTCLTVPKVGSRHWPC